MQQQFLGYLNFNDLNVSVVNLDFCRDTVEKQKAYAIAKKYL
jgi:hypothetical protein